MDELTDDARLLARFETLVDASGMPTLKISGELDMASAGPISQAIEAIVANRPTRVVVDLSDLRFIDSSGLSLFLILADQVAEVEIRNPSAIIRKVIDVTGLSSIFVISP